MQSPALSNSQRTKVSRLCAVVVTLILVFVLAGCQVPPENHGVPEQELKSGVDPDVVKLLPADLQEGGDFTIATNAPYPPYEIFAAPGRQELVGMEIDLGNALGSVMGLDTRFIQQSFDGLVPGVQAGKYQAVMATLRATEEREEQLDIVNYAKIGGTGLMVLKEDSRIDGYEDLCGRTAGVQSGAVQHDLLVAESDLCVKEGRGAITVRYFPNFTDIQLSLFTGGVDVVVGDAPVLLAAASAQPNVRTFVDEKGPRASVEEGFVGIGLPHDSPELVEAFTAALRVLVADGRYDRILKQYKLEYTALDNPHQSQLGEDN